MKFSTTFPENITTATTTIVTIIIIIIMIIIIIIIIIIINQRAHALFGKKTQLKMAL